jgi:hypothetical protein
MKTAIAFLFVATLTAASSAGADPIKSPLGDLVFDGGKIFLNSNPIERPSDQNSQPISLFQEDFFSLNKNKDRWFLMRNRSFNDNGSIVIKYYILDASKWPPLLAGPTTINLSDSQYREYHWEDNNYAYVQDEILFFGIFKPTRKQFIYKNGILKENTGKWAGPAKPEKYIEPQNPGPCFNVAGGYDECIKDLERNKKKAKQ